MHSDSLSRSLGPFTRIQNYCTLAAVGEIQEYCKSTERETRNVEVEKLLRVAPIFSMLAMKSLRFPRAPVRGINVNGIRSTSAAKYATGTTVTAILSGGLLSSSIFGPRGDLR